METTDQTDPEPRSPAMESTIRNEPDPQSPALETTDQIYPDPQSPVIETTDQIYPEPPAIETTDLTNPDQQTQAATTTTTTIITDPEPQNPATTTTTSDPEPQIPTTTTTPTTTDPLTNPYDSLNSHCHELSTLQDLATRGAWRTVLDKIARARSQSLLTKPHEHLIYLTFNVLALTKLRRFNDAHTELEAHLDNDTNTSLGFTSPQYLYKTYPNHYPNPPPNPTASMIPFALRWLHAHLPFTLNHRQQGLDRLYALLVFIRTEKPSNDIWRRREIFVLNTIISHHLSQKEFKICLDLLRDLASKDENLGNDPIVVSKIGYIQMQYGDLEGAKKTFSVVETLIGEKPNNLVSRNKALVYIVGKDYVSAVREYDECISRDESDFVAINNKALCLMYLRDLSDAIKVFETSLERVPTVALNETLVVNLCSMYELAYVNHSDTKKTLSTWIARIAPDDFDSSCTRT